MSTLSDRRLVLFAGVAASLLLAPAADAQRRTPRSGSGGATWAHDGKHLVLGDRWIDPATGEEVAPVPEAEADPALCDGEGGLATVEEEVCELLDRAELTQALERIWLRVRRLNRYVEESKPWELAREAERPGDLDRVLYNLAEGVRVVTLLLHAYMPESTDRLLGALGEENRALAAFGSRAGGQGVERIPPMFPKLDAEA